MRHPRSRALWFSLVLTTALACKPRDSNPSSVQATGDASVLALLHANGVSDADIAKLLSASPDQAQPKRQYWVLNLRNVTQKSAVPADLIRKLVERKEHAAAALAAALALTAAGITLLLVPGGQSLSLVVLQGLVAKGAIFYGAFAANSADQARIMETQDVNTYRPLILNALKQLIETSPAKISVGRVTDVVLSRDVIKSFSTDQGCKFEPLTTNPNQEMVFVTYSSGCFTQDKKSAGRVLNLTDGHLLDLDQYELYATHMAAASNGAYLRMLDDWKTYAAWHNRPTGDLSFPDRWCAELCNNPTRESILARRYGQALATDYRPEIGEALATASYLEIQNSILGGVYHTAKGDFDAYAASKDERAKLMVTLRAEAAKQQDVGGQLDYLSRIYSAIWDMIIERALYLGYPGG